tara:strand:- start:989 stop:1558 length:570 start_codon:yes stop_codon:yes gene_type:complete
MKISKNQIKELILNVISEQEVDASGSPVLKTGSKSTSQRTSDAVKRIKSAGDELTNTEKNLVDQFEKFLSDLAATPGVDLMRNRALLQKVIVLLQKATVSQRQKQPQNEQIEEACGDQQPHMQSHCADDHEASMAKAQLYRLHKYSTVLQELIHEGDELEGWVQAKITKAADYIESVKHYLEYEKLKEH